MPERAWRLLYSLLLALALPWVWARLYWKGRREPAYRQRVGERFGRSGEAPLPAGAIWFHTVSAGETNAAAAVVRAVGYRLPQQTILVTTMTPSGSARVRALLGDQVAHCYAPYDFPWAVRRFLRRARPKALILMETELWPNLIALTVASGASAYVVNARLSERSYRRYRRALPLVRPMLQQLRCVVCQYEDTATRFRALGAQRVEVVGSVKFDAELPPDDFGVASLDFGDAPAWIAGSTHAGEEDIVLDAHRRLRKRWPNLRLILVPRHPERVPEVADLARRQGFAVECLSQRQAREPIESAVLIGDVMGTLAHLYAFAQVAFVGGSLDDTGGHNPIEAATQGLPVMMGPARFKIEEICARFEAADCFHAVANAADIERVAASLLADPQRRAAEGERARAVVTANRGAGKALEDLLCGWLGG